MVTTLPQPTETAAPTVPRPEVLPSEILERDGWCQWVFMDDWRQHCLVGAWNYALGFDPVVLPRIYVDALCDVLRDEHDAPDGLASQVDVAIWNNDPARQPEDVIRVSIEAEKRLGWRE